ncbi:MAG TPA: SPOR domain-containing protein [Steroidobacteraceae bacterium]|nr:SPOR domain-containing protein [Steroidobacteraceae bacterium]
MLINKTVLAICCAVLLGIGGCSRQQSDWQKTREGNSTDAYEQFLKKYPSGEFSAQAQARLKEMYEERDWQKARDADTPEAYQAFLKQYPEGKWTEEARIRVENFTLAQTPAGTGPATGAAGAAPNGSAPGGEESAAPPPPAKAPAAPPPSAAPVTSQKPERSAPASAERGESGKYAVQLGAFKSGHAAADERWVHLQKEYPKLLGGLSSKVLPRKSGGGTLYRLQAVGLSESHARKICKVLRAKSQPCVVVRPAHRHSTSGN